MLTSGVLERWPLHPIHFRSSDNEFNYEKISLPIVW